MPFTIKHNKRIKFKGVWKHYDSRHFISPPPTHTLGRSIVFNDSRKRMKIEEDDEEWGRKGCGKLTIFRMEKKNEHGNLFLTGTAVPLIARAVPTLWHLVYGLHSWRHGRATTGTGRANLLAFEVQNFFFLLSNQPWTITYKIRNKKEKRLNVWVASHEALF